MSGKWIGHFEEEPIFREFETRINLLQFCLSIITVILWIYKTYMFRVFWLEFVINIFYMFAHLLDAARYQFDPMHTFSSRSLIDVFTVVPLFLQEGGFSYCGDLCPRPSWVTFSYIRAVRVLFTWREIENSSIMSEMEEFTRAMIRSLIKFIVIVIFFAGTMFVFETLGEEWHLAPLLLSDLLQGDLPGGSDKELSTGMGSTSFMTMCYYTFVTISTVGYGDYAPSTVLGRLFVIAVILGGVLFFSIETGTIMAIAKLSATGKGKFTPRNPKAKHVLVIGGGVVSGSISVLESFLLSLVSSSHGDKVPEVVLMAPKGPEEEMVALLNTRWATRANIKYLWGSPASVADLERARISNVEICFVLADLNNHPMREDLQNIVRAAAVYRIYKTPMLVMMMEAKHIKYAVQAGIPESMCCGLDDLEISTIASSCQCVGLSTMIINLALPDIEGLDEYEPQDAWLEEYMDGASKELYGLQLRESYTGKDFCQTAREVYEDCGVMLIAAQDRDGQVVMNPGSRFIVQDSTVFFCIANDEDSLESIRRHEGRDWLIAYENNRNAAIEQVQTERRRIAATMSRPALLALSELNDVGNEMGNFGADGEEDDRKTAYISRTRSVAKSTATSKRGGAMPVGVVGRAGIPRGGAMGRLGYPRIKKEEKKQKPVQPLPSGSDALFEEEEFVSLPQCQEEIVKRGNHIVIIGLDNTGSLFPQITSTVRQLRTQVLPTPMTSIPITILYERPVSSKILEFLAEHTNVVYIQGSPLKLRSLIRAGVDRCAKLLVISGSGASGGGAETIMMDQDAILLQSIFESQCALWSHMPTVICELQVPANIKQLSEDVLSKTSASASIEELNVKTTFSSKGTRTHLRYASGLIVHRAEFSSLFAAAYYTPGVLDLLKSMCKAPQSPFSSIVWKIPANKEIIGKTFAQVFSEMIKIDAIPIGIYRRINPKKGNTLPIVYTCPDPSAIVDCGDCVYIMASIDWCKSHAMYTEGIFDTPREEVEREEILFIPRLSQIHEANDGEGRDEQALNQLSIQLQGMGEDGTLREHGKCPLGHRLKPICTPDEGWACDECSLDSVPAGTSMYGCKKWVCCMECYDTHDVSESPYEPSIPTLPRNDMSRRNAKYLSDDDRNSDT
ncbi:hypothetical protein GUITHDRAFT_148767 [Guillardia theta CCMP2712]|uniref:Potassium channel domain-containing protein n=1 Tax=Guillardia theta (strain CCMP2712) TaxID=905079 RepID=L1I7J1_GUITC|nr:hypothetical protein GUITHDRAFT_148767 [Guillardia theta CCMP2712]EKX32213.1 hypothetical protein GUITHDRAFT_148767 [Guillardia theta CCMP2712]|eukprot:XP_005819193.1 hypothetical protein GUITHDRAFT_148767 [Guillardia theta CCMP2712]